VSFYESWIKPNNARLVIAGDVSMQEIMHMLSTGLQDWTEGKIPESPSPVEVKSKSNVLYFLDRPDSTQSIVIAGYLIAAHREETAIATEHMNDILGGQFISRINMNLREDKHWTYGSRSFILETKGQRPYLTYASVQSDKTLESILEIKGEYSRFVRDNPVTENEFQKNKKNSLMALPGQWETNAAIADSLASLVKLGLRDDYYQTYPELLTRLSKEDVHRVSQEMVRSESLNWLVVGDAEKVLPVLMHGGFETIVQVDIEGNQLATFSGK
jgi:predicted Zn-dependent peptidase